MKKKKLEAKLSKTKKKLAKATSRVADLESKLEKSITRPQIRTPKAKSNALAKAVTQPADKIVTKTPRAVKSPKAPAIPSGDASAKRTAKSPKTRAVRKSPARLRRAVKGAKTPVARPNPAASTPIPTSHQAPGPDAISAPATQPAESAETLTVDRGATADTQARTATGDGNGS
ncbi:MAG: hypothetical protein ABI646_05500 [Acidobacteriota bacterium]